MGLFTREQIEDFMKQTKEIIENAEMLLANNPNLENADDVKNLIESQKEWLVKYSDRLENEKFVSVKATSINCCAECNNDFKEGEVCYFTWYENNVFCYDCKEIMNTRVTESYLDWKPRIHMK